MKLKNHYILYLYSFMHVHMHERGKLRTKYRPVPSAKKSEAVEGVRGKGTRLDTKDRIEAPSTLLGSSIRNGCPINCVV